MMNSTLHLSTTQDVFLIIIISTIALFFFFGAVLLIVSIVLVSKVKKVILKAEETLQSVENATEAIKMVGSKVGGPLSVLKIIASILEVTNKRRKG